MESKEINIDSINTVSDLIAFYNNISLEYGRILVVRLINEQGYLVEYRTKDELKKITDFEINNTKRITMSIYNDKEETYAVEVDRKTNKCIITNATITNRNVIVQPTTFLSPEAEQKLIEDSNFDYYKFDNGVYVKYSHIDHLYYKTNRNYDWVQDNGVLSWFMDSEHNYETLKKNGVSKVR